MKFRSKRDRSKIDIRIQVVYATCALDGSNNDILGWRKESAKSAALIIDNACEVVPTTLARFQTYKAQNYWMTDKYLAKWSDCVIVVDNGADSKLARALADKLVPDRRTENFYHLFSVQRPDMDALDYLAQSTGMTTDVLIPQRGYDEAGNPLAPRVDNRGNR
ncbi:MAG: hypothetical protein GWP74_02720 [Proteobacteria bacterium]|nr:hypothetical protein [Pseudomonadota bacterium]